MNFSPYKLNKSGVFIPRWNEWRVDSGVIRDIVIDPQDNVLLLRFNQISIYNSSGKFMYKLGSSGKNDGQFIRPRGITVDSEGCVYVADTGNHRIQKFAPNPDYKPE